MNQDQLKEKLLLLQDEAEDFKLLFSGKTSKKVNGLYKPETREIIIHNRNFSDDNSMIYTAVHEFAHHIHFTTSIRPISCRAHTIEFRNIFHRLLQLAEEKNLYLNVFEAQEDFKTLTREIKGKFLSGGGELMKEFGRLLLTAKQLCDKHSARFEDYIERVLCMQQNAAVTFMKLHTMNVNPEVGFENMKTIASIRDENKRREVETAFLRGDSPDMVKAKIREKPQPDSQVDYLLRERDRVQKTIDTLQHKLETLEEKLRIAEGIA